MLRRPFPIATLSALRDIGDPKLDDPSVGDDIDVAKYFANVAAHGLDVALAESGVAAVVIEAATTDFDEAIAVLELYCIEAEVAINRARGLFTKYGDEICAALLLAGLPNSYATAWGARVLVAHGDLVWALPRRVRQTAMFLMTVLTMDEAAATRNDPVGMSTIIETAAGLRLFHHVLRTQLEDQRVRDALGEENRTPINQEDLLGTLLTFSVTTFGVLEQFGVNWSHDDRESYLLFWDLVGAALGIGTQTVRKKLAADLLARVPLAAPAESGIPDAQLADVAAQLVDELRAVVDAPDPLRPQTVDDAEQLLDQLHSRQWLPVQETVDNDRPFPWSGLVAGRMLTGALLAALADAMPAPKRSWPSVVVRELAPTIVRARLGLDRSGMSTYATRWFADRSRYMKVARAATLRMMANDITSHAMQSFLRADGPPFRIPGLDLRELTTSRTGQSTLVDTTADPGKSTLVDTTADPGKSTLVDTTADPGK